jgi:hypothetical protein
LGLACIGVVVTARNISDGRAVAAALAPGRADGGRGAPRPPSLPMGGARSSDGA